MGRAVIEHQPRRLLQAVAAGVPVVASDACGLAGTAGVTTFATGDSEAFRDAVMSALAQRDLVSARGREDSASSLSPPHQPGTLVKHALVKRAGE